MDLKYLIRRPIVSEKSLFMANTGKFTFEVDANATKPQIKEALKQYFGVHVVEVRTVSMHGKRRRVPGKRAWYNAADWKKAVVVLAKGERLPQFESWFSLNAVKEAAADVAAEKKSSAKAEAKVKKTKEAKKETKEEKPKKETAKKKGKK